MDLDRAEEDILNKQGSRSLNPKLGSINLTMPRDYTCSYLDYVRYNITDLK